MDKKRCRKCGKKKPKSEFWKDAAKADGLCGACISCKHTQNLAYQKTVAGKKACYRYTKKYRATAAGKASVAAATLRYSRKFPEKNRARAAVGYAIKTGKLQPARKFTCTYCPAAATEYHHHNGYAPEHKRDVIPVCKACHDTRTHG